jgi:FMN hydrolase / 5-amino-6-(5-phospho-D-ribitylamino)uracil phosphatase
MIGPAIEAVSFDLDGTLFDFEGVMWSGLDRVAEAVRQRHPEVEISGTELQEVRDAVARELPSTAYAEIRRRSFEHALAERGVADRAFADELFDLFLEHRYAAIELYPDARRALAALRGQVKVGVISNGNSFVDRCGIDFPFDFALYSEREGSSKPEPHLFERAATACGCGPEGLLHVGDSLAEDVLGAIGAGCGAVWLRRRRGAGAEEDQAPESVPVIRTLDELIVGPAEAPAGSGGA